MLTHWIGDRGLVVTNMNMRMVVRLRVVMHWRLAIRIIIGWWISHRISIEGRLTHLIMIRAAILLVGNILKKSWRVLLKRLMNRLIAYYSIVRDICL